MKKIYLIFGLGLAFVISAIWIITVMVKPDKVFPKRIVDFDTCVAAGFQVEESYPARCRASGKYFVQNIGNELDKRDLIMIDSPRPNQVISSPVVISGRARGNWFFEASFPARLLDANGRELAVMPVQAEGNWMTSEFVPFRAVMNYSLPQTATGTLILEKDNPSGLPENADRLLIPVRFSRPD